MEQTVLLVDNSVDIELIGKTTHSVTCISQRGTKNSSEGGHVFAFDLPETFLWGSLALAFLQ